MLGRERPPSKTTNARTKVFTMNSDIEKQRHNSLTTIGQTRRGVTMKKVLGGRIRCRIGKDANLEIMPIWKSMFPMFFSFTFCKCQDPRIARAYTVQKTIFDHFSLVCLSPHPRSCRGAERIRQGEGRWSRPSKTALERSDLMEKFQFRESHTEAETTKSPHQIPVRSKTRITLFIYMYCKNQNTDRRFCRN